MLSARKTIVSALVALAAALSLPATASATPAPSTTCGVMDLMMMTCTATFADTAVGQTTTATVELSADMGPDEFTIGTPADARFTLANDTCTGVALNGGDTCTFDVVFTAVADGDPTAHQVLSNLIVDAQSSMGGPGNPITLDATQHGGASSAPATGTLSPTSATFPDTGAGGSTTQTLTVTSTSATVLSISGATITGTDASNFSVAGGTCVLATLNQGDTCTLKVRFSPPAGTTGASAATLELTSSADTAITAALSGTAVAAVRALTVAPATVNKGTFRLGTSFSQTFTYTNGGNVDVALTGVTLGAALAKTADTCTGATVAPASTCAVTVTWEPTALGAASTTVKVVGDLTATGTLTGTATDQGLTVDPSSVDFGTIHLGDRRSKIFTFTNVGTATVNLTGVTHGSDLSPVTDTCTNAALAPGDSCAVEVLWMPMAPGTRTATLKVVGDETATATLTAVVEEGAAVDDALQVKAITLEQYWATAEEKDVKAKLTTVFWNTGLAPLDLSHAVLSEGIPGTSVTSDSCSDKTLTSLQSCAIVLDVTQAVYTAGVHTATITLASTRNTAVAALKVTGGALSDGQHSGLIEAVVNPGQANQTTITGCNLSRQTAVSCDAANKAALNAANKRLPTNNIKVADLARLGVNVTLTEDATTAVLADEGDGATATDVGLKVQGEDGDSVKVVQSTAPQSEKLLAGQEKETSGAPIGSTSRVAVPKGKMKLKSRKCARGTCTLKLKVPAAPGLYAATLVTVSAKTGKVSTYAIAVTVRSRLVAPKAAERCVTVGQGASTAAVSFGVSQGARLGWTLSAAAKAPKAARGCEGKVRWPKLTAASRALASGVVAGTGTKRTTAMAKILTPARLATLKPGFYRVRFAARANGLVSSPADWWIQVLPREGHVGS